MNTQIGSDEESEPLNKQNNTTHRQRSMTERRHARVNFASAKTNRTRAKLSKDKTEFRRTLQFKESRQTQRVRNKDYLDLVNEVA